MAFSFTHDDIGNKVIEKAQKDGVKVSGVFEKRGSGTQYSELGKMKAAGLDVKVDGNKYVLHHKVFVIDEKTVITGSHNFSASAEKKNDENLIIIEDPNIARLYMQEYQKVYDKGVKPE